MEGLEAEVDPVRRARKRLGIRVGVFGLILLFASAISLRFVPTAWELAALVLLATGAAFLIIALLLVR